jgi:hypothetical protein
MSGWTGRGPRARAASTSSAKAASRSGGTARSHSAVICLARTFAASRCSRSCLDLFVTWTSSGIPGISADWGSHFAPIADACPAAAAMRRPAALPRPDATQPGSRPPALTARAVRPRRALSSALALVRAAGIAESHLGQRMPASAGCGRGTTVPTPLVPGIESDTGIPAISHSPILAMADSGCGSGSRNTRPVRVCPWLQGVS